MTRIGRRFLSEQQRQRYQQFLLSNPSDDQQLEYFQNNFENLSTRKILNLFRVLNLREPPRLIQTYILHRELQNTFEQRNRNPTISNMAAQPAVEFICDPFYGNINPGTKIGAQLYLKATASISEDDKFDLKISTAQKFLDLMTQDADAFG